MSDTRIPTFVGLSSILTGVPASELSPFADVLDLKTVFFDKLVAEVEDGPIDALFERYKTLASGAGIADPTTPDPASAAAQQVGNAIMNPGAGATDSELDQADICSAVIKMWYLGSWYPVVRPDDGDPASFEFLKEHYFSGRVVTSQAYIRGWVWKMAQAHPMGYSQYAFGYWAKEPPSLEDHVEGN